jgi:lysophospholipase L1-like esterase
MALAAARAKQIAWIFRIGLGVAVLGYGLYIAEPGAPRLMIFGLTLFALPLLFQFSPWPLARAYALWFGAFLVLQGVMTPVLLGDSAYLVLHRPNLASTVTITEGVLPGIAGPQRITTDERGFRVTPPVDYAHKSGVRIFAIGASTTEGILIDDEATWTHHLQVALAKDLGRRVEVINTGIAGLRTRHHLATLKDILPLQPDIVLFLVGANDWIFDIYSQFGGNQAADRRMLFPDTLLGRVARGQFNRISNPPEPAVWNSTVTVETFPRGTLGRAEKISWFPETASEQYRANLLRISDICRANRLTCVFLTQPNAYQNDAPQDLRDLFWLTPPNASYTLTFESLVRVAQVYNRALIDFAKQHGHPVCDLVPQIAPTTENFWNEIHYTLTGAGRVAELVTECVKPLVAAIP